MGKLSYNKLGVNVVNGSQAITIQSYSDQAYANTFTVPLSLTFTPTKAYVWSDFSELVGGAGIGQPLRHTLDNQMVVISVSQTALNVSIRAMQTTTKTTPSTLYYTLVK